MKGFEALRELRKTLKDYDVFVEVIPLDPPMYKVGRQDGTQIGEGASWEEAIKNLKKVDPPQPQKGWKKLEKKERREVPRGVPHRQGR